MAYTRPSPSAFTLLEMSIVLVVIALLVGATLSLNNYLANSRLITTMNQAKQLSAAALQFQMRYNTMPGDYATASSAWTGAGNGDGNGLIRAAAVAVPLERYYAFQHLGLAGFIPGAYTGAVNGTGGATIGVNVMGNAMDNGAFILDHPDATDGIVSGDTLYFDGTYGNLIRIAAVNAAATTIPDQPLMTARQAYMLDVKFDDGQPGLGNILTPISTALANCATTAVATTAAYDTNSANFQNAKTCYLFLMIQ